MPEVNATDPVVKRWLDEIALARKDRHDRWVQRGKKVIDRYRDERTETELAHSGHKMNILWSNVETLKPALYARTPKPSVQRRNKDRDPVGKWAAIVLERCLSYSVAVYDFDYVMRSDVTDYLLPGRGQAWVCYRPEFDGEYVSFEYAECKYVHWQDFLTNPARTWEEVWWVAKRAYLTRDEIKRDRKFASVKTEEIVLDHKPDDKGAKDAVGEQSAKATVWEIWSKSDRKVYFIAPGYAGGPLAVIDPPVRYDGFFPCPRPLTASTDTDSIIPIPDFAQYQDQADEIDLLTNRIGLLSKALRVSGVYDGAQKSIERLLADGTDNQLIPVDNWAMMADKGGLKGVVDWFPLDQVVGALQQCYLAREQAKQTLYEVTGIGDIIRGATDANETATAQQIKSQWGSLRIRDRQAEVQRFARDLFRLKAEVIAEQFSPETIKDMSKVTLLTEREKSLIAQAQQLMQDYQQQATALQQQGVAPPPPPQIPQIPPEMLKMLNEPSFDQVVALLKNERLRGFTIGVETDSTIQPDENAERENRVQLVTAMSQYMPVMADAVSKVPESADMMGEFLMFVLRGWNGGEQLESTVENFVDQIKNRAANPQPPQPTPDAVLKAETEKQIKGAELQQRERESQREASSEARKQQIEVGKAIADTAVESQRLGHEAESVAMDRARVFSEEPSSD